MKRPSDKICFKADKQDDTIQWQVIKAFAEEVCKELVSNPEGVHLPKPFNRIAILLYKAKTNRRYDPKYCDKTIKLANDHSEGYNATLVTFPKYNKYRRKRRPNYTGNNLYYYKGYGRLRRLMYELMTSDRWLEFIKFDSRMEMLTFIHKRL